jgi:CheY-like chemotaxis protein
MDRRKILLADDEAYITSILSMKLQALGDEVFVASDGQEAFEIACEQKPMLIVTDFQMPVLSGYELAIKLNGDLRTNEIPVVMLTARGHLLAPGELAKTNIRALQAKPFSARELLSKIEELIGPPIKAAAA